MVEDLGRGTYRVWVKEPPEKGLANKGVILALARHFNVTQKQVIIISGQTSRTKIVAIDR
jgi:uncharacterized protein YggU (UPF0235/DUF167 family)